VNSPANLRAGYQRQLKLELVGPFGGGGGGWHDAGATVTVSVPGVAQSKLVFLAKFVGFAGQGTRPTMQCVMQGPVTVTPVYVSSLNWPVLFLFAGFSLGATALIFGPRWIAFFVNQKLRY